MIQKLLFLFLDQFDQIRHEIFIQTHISLKDDELQSLLLLVLLDSMLVEHDICNGLLILSHGITTDQHHEVLVPHGHDHQSQFRSIDECGTEQDSMFQMLVELQQLFFILKLSKYDRLIL